MPEYIPYGSEWEKEMLQFSKLELIRLLRQEYTKEEKPLQSAPPTDSESKPLILIFEDGYPVRLVDSIQKFHDHHSDDKQVTWLSFDIE